MGYQEYIYKVEKPIKFINNKNKIDKFISNDLIDQVDYSFMEFKEKLENIEPGYYIYIGGDRQFGRGLMGRLDKMLGESNYATSIESAMNCYTKNNKIASKKLKKLFKNKSTVTGRVISVYRGSERNEENQRQL